MSDEASGDNLFKNWIYGTKGLEYLQEGLKDFVGDKALDYWNQQLRDITKCTIGPLQQCNQCTSRNLLPEHANDKQICNEYTKCIQRNPNNCFGSKAKRRRKCPIGICSKLYDVAIRDHRFKDPLWRNTDPTTWCSNPWSFAKCFLNTTGRGTSAHETDAMGLLCFLINNTSMQNYLGFTIPGLITSHPIYEARNIRNKILHKPKMELDGNDLKANINIFLTVLRDPKCIRDYTGAQVAIKKLEQLRDGHITISASDECKVVKLSFNIVKDEAISYERQEYESTGSEAPKLHDVLSMMAIKLVYLEKRIKSQIGKAESAMVDLKNESQKKKGINLSYNIDFRNAREQIPTLRRPHDGRLITLQDHELKGLMSNCEQNFMQGGFGDVYITKATVPGLDVRVVIKRIICEGNNSTKMLAATNEKIASRIMHFAIVPVIAYMDKDGDGNKREFYFISPYLEKGNLFEMVSKDRKCKYRENIVLKTFKRKKILVQIASALDYLHTPVPGVRGITLHMDLTSTNVVLDKKLNARLIDFGLAREMKEGETKASLTESQIFGTPGYYQTKRYSALTVGEDYFNFGVVIRELLTGKEPSIKRGNELDELRKHKVEYIRKTLQSNIWEYRGNPKQAIPKDVEGLIKLSGECLLNRGGNITSTKLVEQIRKICETRCAEEQEDKCDICMVNDAVNSNQSPPHGCPMSVCVSCMRNSHVNPLKCRVCHDEVMPTIGNTYAAVLIAGNDLEQEDLAKSFRRQVEEIKEVLSSKCPCVIGIREENIKIVVPRSPGKTEFLLPQLHQAFVSIRRKTQLKTLMIYFTGHYFKESGFRLGGPDDILTLADMQNQLERIWNAWGKTTRILAFLDCCNAPNVWSVPKDSKEHVKIIQINACEPHEAITQSLFASNFQRFFIQALTRKAFNKNCYSSIPAPFGISSEDDCKECKMTGDFISVEQLLKYISEHMKKCLDGKEPVMYTSGIKWHDTSIGYNIDFIVDIAFKLELGSAKAISVPLSRRVYCDVGKMKERILDKYFDENLSEMIQATSEKIKATPVEFADALALRVQTGCEGGNELGSVLNVSGAWDARREIVASYRALSSILRGRVVSFEPTKFVSKYLEKRELIKNETEGEIEIRLSFEELDRVTDEIKVDIATQKMSKKDSKELGNFYDTLVQVYGKWQSGSEKHMRELRIIFPHIKDDRFEEFFVLDLSVKPRNSLINFNKISAALKRKDLLIPILVSMLAVAICLVFIREF